MSQNLCTKVYEPYSEGKCSSLRLWLFYSDFAHISNRLLSDVLGLS